MTTKQTASLLAAILLLVGAGAHAAPAPTTMTYDSGPNDLSVARLPHACLINIRQVTDERFNKESISTDTPVSTSALEPWVNSGLDGLTAYGFNVQHSSQLVPAALNLDVRLIRAFTWLGDMRINGMVALDVDLAAADGKRLQKYRAFGSKTNMAGSNSEHVTALNYALNHTLYEMAQSLAAECGQSKLAMQ